MKPYPEPFTLSDETAASLSRHLDALSELQGKTAKSEFQELLVKALSFYSKSALSQEPGEKLLLIMTALEVMLLRSEAEAIQQNVGKAALGLSLISMVFEEFPGPRIRKIVPFGTFRVTDNHGYENRRR